VEALYAFLEFDLPSAHIEVASKYPVFIPRRLAQKIKEQGPNGVLAREFLPHRDELSDMGSEDPIGDKRFLKAPQLIHRYPSRALFTATTVCPVHCRYCFRKNELNTSDEIFKSEFEETLVYLRSHPEVSEIIFTGGDPLTLSDERLEFYLKAFATIPSLKDVRFHTRYPVIFPERIDAGILSVLKRATKKFRTVSLAIHANHVDEFDIESRAAIQDLSETGVQLLSQTVLLNGVNDSSLDLHSLMNLFIEMRVRPYYLHHPDQVKGGMHFYVSLEKGRSLFHDLRKNLPGWALPVYILDLPGGDGKTPAYNPETHHFSGQFYSLQGEIVPFQEP
jgi:lysine 2,3-aminomutase